MNARPCLGAIVACSFLLVAASSGAQSSTTAGDLSVEPPTLISLGVDWRISGDDNRNAQVDVVFRKKGDQAWRKAMPLLRLQREETGSGGGGAGRGGGEEGGAPAAPAAGRGVAPNGGRGAGGGAGAADGGRGAAFDPNLPVGARGGPPVANPAYYVAPNMFSGSIFNLDPDTDYEIQLTMTDPDGVTGDAKRTVTAHTRPEPKPAEGGKVYHVYPVGYTGQRQEPSFTGLMAAYYMGAAHFDYENAYPPRVQPGDTILVHAGLYISDRFHYMNGAPRPGYLALGTVFDGTYYLTQNGTLDKPIAIKGAGDGEVIFDGDGAQNLFNLMGGNYNYFEGITVRNTNVAFLLGIKGIAGSSGFTLKQSKIENVGRAVQDDWSGSKNFYIADNVLVGRHMPDKMMGWSGAIWAQFPNYPELLVSEYAIKIYGQGHVVAHNRLINWHDGIDVATYGVPDGAPNEIADRFPMSIDIYENDVSNMGDNCVETDGGGRNIRVFRNRCFNLAEQALSAQPVFDGPIYFIQNLVYNGPSASGPLKYATPAGVIVYQNTLFGEVTANPASNTHYLNNLIIATGTTPAVFSVNTFTNYSTSDYNGFRPNPDVPVSFAWNSPASAPADYKNPLTTRRFKTLAEYSKTTGQDAHSILVDDDAFLKATIPDKTDPQRLYDPDAFDFHLKPGSEAVDAGVVIPNINDGFTGKAPDLGAFETGVPMPAYGPRAAGPASAPARSQSGGR